MIKRMCAIICMLSLLLSLVGMTCVVYAEDENASEMIFVAVESVEDYTESWGRDAISMVFRFSSPYTTAEKWTYITDDYDEYIAVNGVLLSDRRLNPADYEVDANYAYAAATIQPDSEATQMIIQMQGGGILFPNLTETIVVSFDKDMPMADGTLGRDITMVYNAVTGTWYEQSSIKVETFEDYTEEWGRDAISIVFRFSKPFTTATKWTYVTDNYDEYITVNGVLLSDRRSNPTTYDVDANYAYAAATVQPDTESTQMIVRMQGGGVSFPDLNEPVVVSFSKDMPMVNGTLGRDITVVYNPENREWVERNTIDVEVFEDYTAQWGHMSIGMTVRFSSPFTTAAKWTYITDDYDEYITVNGVLLSDRRANPDFYGVDSNYAYAAATIQPDSEPTKMIIQMQGGGVFFPSLVKPVEVSFSKDMPLVGGVLGRDITISYDPALGKWKEIQPADVDEEEALKLTSSNLNDIGADANLGSEYVYEISISLNKPIASEAVYSDLTEELSQYIEINDINLKERYENPELYGVHIVNEGFYGGHSVNITNGPNNSIRILIIGGGEGAPDIDLDNKLVIKEGVVCGNGVLEEDVRLKWDRRSKNWLISIWDEIPVLDEHWSRSENNLITNFYSMYQPEVVYVEAWDDGVNYPYLMYFFAWAYTHENEPAGSYPGYPGGDAIFMARSKSVEGPWEIYAVNRATGEMYWDTQQNPETWEPVIVCQDQWYDSWHVGDPSVVYKDGVFYMAYSAMGTDEDGIPMHLPGDTDGNTSCIMGATSTDGIHWTKSESPLVVWDKEKGFNEVVYAKDYLGGHQRPSILYENGVWRMWYDVRYNEYGYAECEGDFMDASAWTEIYNGENPYRYQDGRKFHVVDIDVEKVGNMYYAYADPYISWYGIIDEALAYYEDDPSNWAGRQIVEYQSSDGIHWEATGYFRPDSEYDSIQIPQIFHDEKNGRLCLFYATQRGKLESDTYDWRWDNIRVMTKSLSIEPNDSIEERT